jgi:glucosamine kinase
MLLIADSGSTKTDWRVVNEEGTTVRVLQSKGLNPYFLTEQEISNTIRQEVLPHIDQVDQVWFYGAGCGLPVKVQQVESAIAAVISCPLPPKVYGDMLGAARSLFQTQPGVACILGTGANSCVYDGKDIVDNVPSLGYILADLGSGTVLCKDLIALILQEKIDEKIRNDFYRSYQMDRREILDKIYNKPMANTFLASFTPFLLKHAEDPTCREIILDNFRRFFQYYVLRYKQYEAGVSVSFVGSIAHHFREYMELVAAELHISIGEIIKNPMEGLVKYHSMGSGKLKEDGRPETGDGRRKMSSDAG